MSKLEKIFLFILIFVLIISGIAFYYNHSLNGKITLNNDEIMQLKKIHEDEVIKLNLSLLEEKRKNVEALKTLQSNLDLIKLTYEKRIKDLEKLKDKNKDDLRKNATLETLANDLREIIK